MILNESCQVLLNLKEKNSKQSLKIDPGTKNTWYVNYNKTILQHFILCNMMCYGALKSNIDRGLRPGSILLISAP